MKIPKIDPTSPISKDPQRKKKKYEPKYSPGEQDDISERNPTPGLGEHIDYLA